MEAAMQEIMGGNLDNLDDMKASGGFPLQISGGKGRKKTVIVGNRTSVCMRDKILEWGTFNEMYPDMGRLGDSGEKSLCNTVKLIISSQSCMDLSSTLEILKITYDMPDKQMAQLFIRRFKFSAATIDTLRAIYSNWSDYLESAVIAYDHARADYIEKYQTADSPNDIALLTQNWSAVDKYYHINSSKPILLFSQFPNRPYDLPWLRGAFTEGDEWDVMPSLFNWKVNGVPEVDSLVKYLTSFVYLGFCPKRPKYRLTQLLTFPIDQLRDAIVALGGDPPESHSKVLNLLGTTIPHPTYELDPIPRPEPPTHKLQCDSIHWYVGQILAIYKAMTPHFRKVENYYTKISKKMSKIGFELG
jgi:hypothetical protein